MPRDNLSYLTVYASRPELDLLQHAADRERRSLSNFVLTAAMERAEKLGLHTRDIVKPKRGRPRKR